jgi:hypothetical protein
VGHIVAAPPGESREQDVIQKTLNAIGVVYSHHNDEILVPSRIEEERTKKMLVRIIFWTYAIRYSQTPENETTEVKTTAACRRFS